MNNVSDQDPIDLEDEDSEDVEPPPPLPSPDPPAPIPVAASGKRRGRPPAGVGAVPRAPGRPRGKAGDVPDRFDPSAKGPQNWSSHQADVLFPELLTWLEANGRSAYDVMVNVIRVEPPPRASVGEGFEANAAIGDTSTTPSDALTRLVSDYYHLPVSRTPAKYELQFVWRANGNYITNAYLSLASPAEIIALRNAQYQRRMNMSYQAPGVGMGSPGIQGPPMLPPMPQQQHQQQAALPYIPFGYPQQAPAPPPPVPVRDPRMEIELERLRMENERLRMDRNRHPPQQQRGPAGYGPPPEDPETRIVRRVVEELRGAGLGAPPAASPALAPALPPGDFISSMRAGLQMMREFRRFSEEAGGMFEPDDVGVGSPLALPAASAPEGADDPYDVTELPSQWGDGSHTKLVRSKETGKVDLLGLALHNPYPSQKLIEAGTEFMKRFAVRGVPSHGFAGPPPEYQQQPDPQLQQPQPEQQQPAMQPEQPAQPEPGSTGGEPGWEDLG